MSDTSVVSRDGTRLSMHRWQADEPQAALLIVHGYFEHGGRYEEFAQALTARHIDVWALDLRGHGRSEGVRGHVRRFEDYLDDVDAGVDAMSASRRCVLGHSLGGLVTLMWTAHRPLARDMSGLILTNPYLERALVVPGWKIAAARVMARAMPTFSLPADLDPALLSHDETRNNAYQDDPLIFNSATAGWFAEVTRAQEASAGIRSLPVPLLMVVGDGDRVARPQASLAAFERIEAPQKELKVLPGQYHEVLNELQRTETFQSIAAWIGNR